MVGLTSLLATCLIERDINNDTLISWSYPAIEPSLEPLLLDRSFQSQDEIVPFSFSKFGTSWIYIASVNNKKAPEDGQEESRPPTLQRWQTRFSIVLIAKDYFPEMFRDLALLMAKAYLIKGNPDFLLQAFLSVMTDTKITFDLLEDGEQRSIAFQTSDYNVREAFLATPIKDLIRMFGMENVLIWTALLMKKRIAVYCSKVAPLLKVIRALPLFVFHRRDWSILRPIITLNDSVRKIEEEELERAGGYVMGILGQNARSKSNLFDLLIDDKVNERTVTVSEHAKNDFKVTSFHKEIANFLFSSAEDPEESSNNIIMELTNKTKEFIGKIHQLQVEDESGNRILTLETLKEHNLPANMAQFISNVAIAEGLMTH